MFNTFKASLAAPSVSIDQLKALKKDFTSPLANEKNRVEELRTQYLSKAVDQALGTKEAAEAKRLDELRANVEKAKRDTTIKELQKEYAPFGITLKPSSTSINISEFHYKNPTTGSVIQLPELNNMFNNRQKGSSPEGVPLTEVEKVRGADIKAALVKAGYADIAEPDKAAADKARADKAAADKAAADKAAADKAAADKARADKAAADKTAADKAAADKAAADKAKSDNHKVDEPKSINWRINSMSVEDRVPHLEKVRGAVMAVLGDTIKEPCGSVFSDDDAVAVKRAQKALKKAGFLDAASVEGDAGPQFFAAVKVFNAVQQLKAKQDTQEALGSAVEALGELETKSKGGARNVEMVKKLKEVAAELKKAMFRLILRHLMRSAFTKVGPATMPNRRKAKIASQQLIVKKHTTLAHSY